MTQKITNKPSINLPPFKAMLVEDHFLFASGFIELLQIMSPNSSITHFSKPEQALQSLSTTEYQFIFADLMIPGSNTTEFINYCRKEYPSTLIIVISTIIDISKVKQCFSLGVNGYLSKVIDPYELKLALEKIYTGDKYISSDINGRLANSIFAKEQNDLTSKELEVLRLIAESKKVDEIAELLFISPYTVMAHRRNIMKKLSLHSAAALVKYAFENKLN